MYCVVVGAAGSENGSVDEFSLDATESGKIRKVKVTPTTSAMSAVSGMSAMSAMSAMSTISIDHQKQLKKSHISLK